MAKTPELDPHQSYRNTKRLMELLLHLNIISKDQYHAVTHAAHVRYIHLIMQQFASALQS